MACNIKMKPHEKNWFVTVWGFIALGSLIGNGCQFLKSNRSVRNPHGYQNDKAFFVQDEGRRLVVFDGQGVKTYRGEGIYQIDDTIVYTPLPPPPTSEELAHKAHLRKDVMHEGRHRRHRINWSRLLDY